ncbi:MAG: ABC transporter permease, partial [Treponema sp.]|nr:ABC transporter permease [Treponema sp.]
VNPNGGSGRVLGVVLSLGIFQVVASGVNLLRISSYLTMALWGVILLAVVMFRTCTGTKS